MVIRGVPGTFVSVLLVHNVSTLQQEQLETQLKILFINSATPKRKNTQLKGRKIFSVRTIQEVKSSQEELLTNVYNDILPVKPNIFWTSPMSSSCSFTVHPSFNSISEYFLLV